MSRLPVSILFLFAFLSACGSNDNSQILTDESNATTDEFTQPGFVSPIADIAGRIVVAEIDWGVSPWASSGRALVEFDVDTYIIRGDLSSVINSTGTYTYSDGTVTMSDSVVGIAEYFLQFTDSSSGLYEVKTNDGVTRQLGAFTFRS